MKSSANQSFNRNDNGTKLKPWHGGPSVDVQGHAQGTFKKQPSLHPQQNKPRAYQISDSFAPLKLLIQDIFKAIQDQPWVSHLNVKMHDSVRLGAKDYCSFHDNKGHRTS